MGEPVRIFLVTPATAIRQALARSLEVPDRVTVVGEARSSSQALKLVPAARPDVVLAGAHLREPDSPEMCGLLRTAAPETHILLIGFYAGRELEAAAVRAGAAGVLPHTVDEQELLAAIETAAGGQMVMSAETLRGILETENAGGSPDPLASLTPLERELFTLVGEGLTNAEIAERLRLSPGTVRNYVSRILRKLQVERRAQVVALAARLEAAHSA